jgi:hypothetical protein
MGSVARRRRRHGRGLCGVNQRWGARHSMGQKLLSLSQSWSVIDDKTFVLADAMQVRSIQITTHVNVGQFVILSAARKNVVGFIAAGPTVFWNVEKY